MLRPAAPLGRCGFFSSSFPCGRESGRLVLSGYGWIPACAGMTQGRGNDNVVYNADNGPSPRLLLRRTEDIGDGLFLTFLQISGVLS